MAKLPPRDPWHASKPPPPQWEFTADQTLIGVDEAGVGPLAGPLIACAVLLRPNVTPRDLEGVRDSKKMTEATRTLWAPRIRDHCACWYVGWMSPEYFDQHGPNCRFELMERCVHAVLGMYRRRGRHEPVLAVVDGDQSLRHLAIPQVALIHGDDRCLPVAAASVIAKHLRDEHMRKQHQLWPRYGFKQHKGYPTEQHLQALNQYGPCPIHRLQVTETTLGRYRRKKGTL